MVQPGGKAVNNEHSFRDLLNVLFKRKWTILIIFSSFLGAMLIGNMRTPLAYEASARLLIQRTRGEVLLSPLDSRSFNVQMAAPQDLNSEADLIKSRPLLEEVAKELRPDLLQEANAVEFLHADMGFSQLASTATYVKTLLQPPNRRKLSPEEEVISNLAQGIRVTPVPASNLIVVRYAHKDPKVAADVVNSLIQNYLDFTVKLRRKAEAHKIFEVQTLHSYERLIQLRQALHSFDEAAGIVAPDSQAAVNFARFAEMENSLNFVRADLARSRAEVRSLEHQLKSAPLRIETVKETKWNAVIDELKKRLAELQIQREQLLSRFTEKHRSVVENETQIQIVEEWLNRESAEVFGTTRSDVNPTAQALTKDLTDARTAMAGLEAKERTLVAEVEGSRQRLAEFHSKSMARDELVREIKTAEDTHVFYKRKTEEARIESVLDESKITNVKVAEWAQPPLGPTGLRRNLFLVLGSGVAMIAAVGTAFGREFFDRSLGTPEEAERLLDLPVLASIPETKDK
jgi:uncharacterized protein involved in exopolysaccharide biosynthesis